MNNCSIRKQSQILVVFFIGLFLTNCSSPLEKKRFNNYASVYGKINADSISTIQYMPYLRPDAKNKASLYCIKDKSFQNKLIKEINIGRYAGFWKGAHWDKIYLIGNDTLLLLTNGKVFGNQNNVYFYKLPEEFSSYWKKQVE